MEETYDVIIMGTGLKECIISGLLSVDGKKVLHIDRNGYYGGETASLNLNQLYAQFKGGKETDCKLGDHREFIVDLCPKFLMACGDLVKTLIHTRVTRYLDFKAVDGSFVFKDNKLYKMPATPAEALGSGLMGFFQKRKLRNFLQFVNKFDENDPKSQIDLKETIRKTFEHFGLDENSQRSVGHALALQLDNSYMDDPSARLTFIRAIKLYAYSVERYGKSPFIYPVYSLNGLPESFARLSAVHGGVYMLNKPVDEILYNSEGKVEGIRCGEEKAFSSQLLGDPSYFAQEESARRGRVARWICLLRHPLEGTNSVGSCQVIIPGELVERKSDIYIAVVSAQHKVAPKGTYLAISSALIETDEPEQELSSVRELMGEIEEEFFFTTELREPTERFEEKDDGVFMTSSYDATTHFESVTSEVLEIYEKMAGKAFDLNIRADPEDVENLE